MAFPYESFKLNGNDNVAPGAYPPAGVEGLVIVDTLPLAFAAAKVKETGESFTA